MMKEERLNQKRGLGRSKPASFLLRLTAWLVLLTFSTQITWAQGPVPAQTETLDQRLPETGITNPTASSPNPQVPHVETSTEFLKDESPLLPVDRDQKKNEKPKESDPQSHSFESVLGELRSEYASAVILEEPLTPKDLKSLLKLPFETAIAVIHGGTVLFTTGNEEEVGVLEPAHHLLDEADFISHTHVTEASQFGPSPFDLDYAVSSPKVEYVLSRKGAFAYNREGVLSNGEPLSIEAYAGILRKAVSKSPEKDPARTRSLLNEFIRQMDLYNEALPETRESFRRAEAPPIFTDGFSGSLANWTAIKGAWGIKNQTLFQWTGAPREGGVVYNGTLPTNDYDLEVQSYFSDQGNARGLIARYQDAKNFYYAKIGTSNTASIVRVQNGVATTLGSNYPGHWLPYYTWHKIRFTVEGSNLKLYLDGQLRVSAQDTALTSGKVGVYSDLYSTSFDNFSIKTLGTTVQAPTVTAPSTYTNQSALLLSGTKPANTSVWVNGVQKVAQDASTVWSYTEALSGGDKLYSFSIVTKDSLGKQSTAVSISTTLDQTAPTGMLQISNDAVYTASANVTLNLTASDGTGSGVNRMSFSTDNTTWTTPEVYATSKTFTLPTGDGNKTVYVKYFDKAGNVSAVYSKSIILDTLPPTGTVTVNGGISFINQASVSLNLSATDTGSGLDKMSFSSDSVTWTMLETYATTKSWTFSSGDGNKTVYVKFLDKSGLWSSPVFATVLLDTVIPVGSLSINSGAAYTNSTAVTLNLSATDSGSGINQMSFSTDNVTWTTPEAYSTSKSFTLSSGDGSKTVYVKYYDKAGNTSTVSSKSITLDTALPTGSIKINNDAAYANSQTVTLNLTGSDSLSGIDSMHFSTDGGVTWTTWEAFAATKALTLPTGDGTKEVQYQLRDKAGNTSTFSDTIILDTIAPEIIFTSAGLTNQAAYTLTYTVDGTLKTESRTLSQEGANPLTITATDPAGNTTTATYSVTLDTKPPVIVFTSPLLTNQSNYTLAYTVDGVEKTEPRTLAQEGMNVLTVTANDLAGNSTTSVYSVTLDTKPPVISNVASSSITTNGVTLSWTTNEASDAQIEYGTTTAYGSTTALSASLVTSHSQTLSGLEAGTPYHYRVKSRDQAGNLTLSGDFTFTSQSSSTGGAVSFTDDFSGSLANWTAIKGAWGIKDQTLFQWTGVPYEGGVVYNGALSTNDYDLEVESYFTDQGNARGLIARYQDAQNFYYAKVTTANEAMIIKVQGGVATTLGYSKIYPWLPYYTWHKIRFTVEGPQLKLYLDGQLRVSAQDTALTSGKVGVYSDLYSTRFDNFSLKTLGAAPLPPPAPPTVNALPAYTNQTSLALSGTKPANTSVWINGVQRVAQDSSASWSYQAPLSGEGLQSFSIQVKDNLGNASPGVSVSTTLDLTPPQIIFTSATKTQDPIYLLAYTLDGIAMQEMRFLDKDGDNVLSVTKTDLAGNRTTQAYTVTLEAPVPTNTSTSSFNLTTQNGDLLQYVGGTVSGAKLLDGTRVNRINLDATGALKDATARLSDGSIQVFQNGQVLVYRKPDGSQIFYTNGEVQKMVTKDGVTESFTFTKDNLGNILEVKIESDEFLATYDNQGRIQSLLSKITGIRKDYTSGMLSRILESDGTQVIYSQTLQSDGWLVAPSSFTDSTGAPSSYTGTGNQLSHLKYTLLKYDPPTFALKEAQDKVGNHFFFENGILTKVLDPQGNQTSISFKESPFLNLTTTEILQNGLTSQYDGEGKLSQVKLNDLTIHYKQDQSGIESIEKEDGTIFSNLSFDTNGNLLGARIVSPDGTVRIYQNGQLVQLTESEGTELDIIAGKIQKLKTPQQLTYDFSYTTDSAQADLEAGVQVPDATTIVRMEYDQNLTLKKMVRQNGEILSLFNNQLVQVDAPSQASEVYSYEKDANGNTLSTTVTKGNVETKYDAQNNPVQSIIHPTTDNPHTLEVHYRYGKIREVLKDGVLTFQYSYSFDLDGKELTQIQDLEEKTLKTYKEGNLLTSFNQDTSLLSTYFYDTQARVSEVKVTRLGKLVHDYLYQYANDLTTVTDEEGVKRTYSKDQKLIQLEKENQKFAYSYAPNLEGEEIVQEELIERKYSDGSVAHYQDGSIVTINLADGSLIRNLVLDQDRAIQSGEVVLPNGTRKLFRQGLFVEEWDPDGTHFLFDSNRILKAIRPDGTELAYTYEKNPDGAIQSVSVQSGGATHRYNPSGDLTEGEAYPDWLKLPYLSLMNYKVDSPDGLTREYQLGALRSVWKGSEKTGDYAYEYKADGHTYTHQTDSLSVLTFDENKNVLSHVLNQSLVTSLNTSTQYAMNEIGIDEKGAISKAVLRDLATGNEWTSQSGEISQVKLTNGSQVFFAKNLMSRAESTTFYQSDSEVNGSTSLQSIAAGNGLTLNKNIVVKFIYDGSGNLTTVDLGTDSQVYSSMSSDGKYLPSNVTYNVRDKSLEDFRIWYTSSSCAGMMPFICQVRQNVYRDDVEDAAGTDLGKYTPYGQDLASRQNTYAGLLAPFQSSAQEAAGRVKDRVAYYSDLVSPVFNSKSFMKVAETALVAPEEVFKQEYAKAGTLETQTKGNGTVTIFEEGRPSTVLDAQGNILIQYSYDALGNPTRVFLRNARDALPNEVAKVKARIEEERQKALLQLAQQKALATASIKSQADQTRAQLSSYISSLTQQLNDLEGTKVHGSKNKKAKSNALDQIRSAISQAWGQWEQLHRAEADAYAALDAQVQQVSDKIESDATAALGELANKEAQLKQEILHQEISPIVYDHYRRILGRDPNQAEYGYWVSQVDYNSGQTNVEILTLAGIPLTQALTGYINSMPELGERQAYVNTVKQNVTLGINGYLGMSQTERLAFAQSLGLSSTELIGLTSDDASKIVTWLNSRSLHFGQSAFLALESLLDLNGISYVREDLATKAILIDILTGVISPLDDGDLVISIYALDRTAALYGLNLVGAKLSFNDLKTLFLNSPTGRVIAHINGNHYVIVTGVSDTSITYIDPGIGKDKQNESVTVTTDAFLNSWKGYVVVEGRRTNEIASIQDKLLTNETAQRIRGAFWGSLLGFIGALLVPFILPLAIPFLIASFVTSLVEGDWISAISSAVAVGFSSFGISNLLKGVFNGVAGALSTVGKFFSNLFNPVVGFLTKALDFLPGIGTQFASKLASQIVSTSLIVGVSYGVSKGLVSLGVSPEFSSFLGSLTAGALVGGLTPISDAQFKAGITRSTMIKASVLQTLTLNNVGSLGLELGLDSGFASLIALSLGAIQGKLITNPGTTLGQVFKNVLPDLSKNFALYGVEKLGTSVGLDPRLSALIGVPIRATVAGLVNGLVNPNGGGGPGAIFNTIKGALLSKEVIGGVISYGASLITGNETLSAALGAFGGTVLSGVLQNMFGSGSPPPVPKTTTNEPKSTVEQVLDDTSRYIPYSFTNLAIASEGENPPVDIPGPTDLRSSLFNLFIQGAIALAQILLQKGLDRTVEEVAPQVFQRPQIEAVAQSSYGSFENLIRERKQSARIIDYKGGSQNAKEIDLSIGGRTIKIVTSLDQSQILLIQDHNRILEGEFYLGPNQSLVLKNGTITTDLGDGRQVIQEITEWRLRQVEVRQNGTVLGQLGESTTGQGVFIDPQGVPVDALISQLQDKKISIEVGAQGIVEIRSSFVPPFDDGMKQAIAVFSTGEAEFANAVISIQPQPDHSFKTQLILDKVAGNSQGIDAIFKALGYVGSDPAKIAEQKQANEILEKLRNGLLRYGYKTDLELAAHKQAEIQKIRDNPGKAYIILTKTDAPLSFVTRAATGDLTQSESWNHSALYYGDGGHVLHIDAGASARNLQTNGISTDLENLPIDQFASRYKDVEVIEVQLPSGRSISDLQKVIYDPYVNEVTNLPKAGYTYDIVHAIGGYLSPTLFPVNQCDPKTRICTDIVNDIFELAFGHKIVDSSFVSPDDFDRRKNSQGVIVL